MNKCIERWCFRTPPTPACHSRANRLDHLLAKPRYSTRLNVNKKKCISTDFLPIHELQSQYTVKRLTKKWKTRLFKPTFLKAQSKRLENYSCRSLIRNKKQYRDQNDPWPSNTLSLLKWAPVREVLVIPYAYNSGGSYPLHLELLKQLSLKLRIFGIWQDVAITKCKPTPF